MGLHLARSSRAGRNAALCTVEATLPAAEEPASTFAGPTGDARLARMEGTLVWRASLPAAPLPARAVSPALPAEVQEAVFQHERAAAICDLLNDPASGITRVSVTRAGSGLVDAIHREALDRGLVAASARPSMHGVARVVVARRAQVAAPVTNRSTAAGRLSRWLSGALRRWRAQVAIAGIAASAGSVGSVGSPSKRNRYGA
jgi:hypothetical protein